MKTGESPGAACFRLDPRYWRESRRHRLVKKHLLVGAAMLDAIPKAKTVIVPV
jgi:hypothetical protein